MVRFFKIIIIIGFFSFSNCIEQGTTQNRSENWQELFNGVDLTGWHLLNGKHDVEVVDGVIVGTSIHGLPNGFLATEKEFDDFILELEVKADILLHNSGIQFRSRTRDDAPDGRVYGYQAEIDTTPQEWSGAIYDEARRGWLYILEDYGSPAKKAWVNNQWNHYRIEAIGTTLRIWVNGIPTAHLIDNASEKGFIALQLHANTRNADPPGRNRVYFRNIKVKTNDLVPTPYDDIPVVNLIPNTISPQEKQQGFKLLFDGESMSGWRGVESSQLPQTGWKVKDGAITIISTEEEKLSVPLLEVSEESRGGGVIMTANQFSAFDLRFDFKQHLEGGIIGIEYLVQSSSREVHFGRLAANKTRFMGQWNQGGIYNEVGDWNQGRIIVRRNGEVEYWVNQRMIMKYHRDSNDSSMGHILFDDYGSSISYRSIKLKEL